MPETSPHSHLLGIADLEDSQIVSIFERAKRYVSAMRGSGAKFSELRGKTLLNVFYEASTRTRTSFELAGKRLGADVVNIASSTSSATKGETLRDTIGTLDAMHADVIVVRHAASGAANYLARFARGSVINAGDGLHEHPTQALLDAFTMLAHKPNLRGLKVAICGDIQHSRVVRSNALLLPRLGAEVHLAGPLTLLPHAAAGIGCIVHDRIEPALEGADVVIMLRIQQERLLSALLPSLREYSRVWGLNSKRLALAKPDVLVMHPGPLNRGVEIADDVANGDKSVILEQVESGVAVRMAVLTHCLGV